MAEQHSSEEIDLGYLLKRSNDFLKSIVRGLFLILDFFRRFFIVVLVLLLIGFGYGYYKDANEATIYNNEVILIPNFDSVDYLYDKVEAINKKISARDTIFLDEVAGANFKNLKRIAIEPISDLYNFVSKNNRNFDVLRLISEKKDLFEYLEDPSITKHYKYHRMRLTIEGVDSSKEVVSNVLAYLNSNDHLQNYQKIYQENNSYAIQQHYRMIAQVDSVLKANSEIAATASNVSITNSTDLFSLVDRKRQMLEKLLELQRQTLDFEKPIKEVSVDYNLKTKRFLSLSNKVKYPLVLVFLFSMVFFIIYVFRRLRNYSRVV